MGLISKEKNIFNEYDYKALNNIKALALDMINNSGSGHSGIVLSAANIMYDLYSRHLIFNNKEEKFINRDRFIMSSGHGSALLYATLYMCGFNIKIEDLKSFRKYNSKTPGHPELNVTPGVDFSTGPLGQGFASAVGVAIAERFLNKRYENNFINHYTYVLCGDGDLMEGISYEAASVAGNLKLNKLIVLYDSNNVTLDTDTKETFKENVLERFKAMNWDTQVINNDLNSIDDAINKAKNSDKPSLIEVKTIIGEGLDVQNTSRAHGYVPSCEDITKIKQQLKIRDVAFTVSKDAYTYLNDRINSRIIPYLEQYYKNYEKNIDKFKYKKELENLKIFKNVVNTNNIVLDINEEKELRNISKDILNILVDDKNLIMLGSADVATSTKVYADKMGNFTSNNYSGRNILFGVREHAMGAILNGIASCNIRVIGSTFLSFSDYLKPAIRMAALMNLPVTYIFTHDSILVGEDGPTHHPIEQLVSLRAIPNLVVYRPGDLNELIGSYKSAMKRTGPSVIIVTKKKTKLLTNTSINDVEKGAYLVKGLDKTMGIIISTGSELSLALDIQERLVNKNVYLNVVSMPSIELFESQDQKYKENLLPYNMKKVVIEYSSSYSWYKYVYNEKYLFNINNFCKSGNKNDILKSNGLDIDTITDKIENLFL